MFDLMQADKTQEFNGQSYSARHGGPFDRGAADSYYGRPYRPHFFRGATYQSEEVSALTADELEAYNAGYDYNERFGDKKSYE